MIKNKDRNMMKIMIKIIKSNKMVLLNLKSKLIHPRSQKEVIMCKGMHHLQRDLKIVVQLIVIHLYLQIINHFSLREQVSERILH